MLAKRIGADRIVCNEQGDETRCILQLSEIANRANSEDDQKHFVDAIRIIAAAYIDRGRQNITLQEIVSQLQLSELEAKKLSEMLGSAGQISDMYGPRGSLDFYLRPLDRMLWFRDIKSIDDYFAMHATIDDEEAEGRQLDNSGLARALGHNAEKPEEQTPDVPTSDYHLNNDLLDGVYSYDRAELARTVEIEAWKATAVLAGACLESLLLDVWEMRPAEAEREFGESWRANTRADRLAKIAIRSGYLTENQGALADLLRRWRNIIHPVAALRESAPTKELANLLVAALNFLVAELRGAKGP
ncbi:MAG: hypothetical protein ACJ8AK_16660 [Gemmatimonadaceae bacterium]